VRVWTGLLIAVAATCLIGVAPAGATTFTATRFDDPATGSCAPNNCSLRQAIAAANGHSGDDVVALRAGTYRLTQGELFVSGGLTMVGAGAASTFITGSHQTGPSAAARAGAIDATGNLTMVRITVSGNTATADAPTDDVTVAAGGILDEAGTLTILNSVVAGNTLSVRATTGAGGVATNAAKLVLVNSTVSGNSATNGGTAVAAGVLVNSASTPSKVTASTISGNHLATTGASTVAVGGMLANVSDLELTNTTISSNTAGGSGTATIRAGGAMVNVADLSAENDTIDLNSASGGGAQAGNLMANVSSNSTLENTIVADGSAPSGSNCAGTFTSLGGNVETANQCGLQPSLGDQPSVDPGLGPLQDNGGPTQTQALPPGSPAIDDALPGADCLPVDQRGVPRPEGLSCDSGAYEAGPPSDVTAPAVAGRPQVGQTLSCAPGTWRGAATFAFSWLRNGVAISGARSSSYQLVRADASKAIQCRVTAANAEGSTAAVSSPRGVSGVPLPVNHRLPSLTGKLQVGKRVQCHPGRWSGALRFTFAWLRNGNKIKNARRSTYRIVGLDAGRALQCQVTAHGAGGSVSAFSAPRVPSRA
jgi:hypothetical protein